MLEIALTCTNATLNVEPEGTFHLRWVAGGSLQPMLIEVVDVCMSPGARETLPGLRFVSAVALVGPRWSTE